MRVFFCLSSIVSLLLLLFFFPFENQDTPQAEKKKISQDIWIFMTSQSQSTEEYSQKPNIIFLSRSKKREPNVQLRMKQVVVQIQNPFSCL